MRRTMDTVDDGIIVGQITKVRHWCENCHRFIRCIKIESVTLPEGVELGWTKIALREPDGTPIEGEHIDYIGIGCGDYAKFHRQVKSIQLRRQAKGVAPQDQYRNQLEKALEMMPPLPPGDYDVKVVQDSIVVERKK